MKFPELETSRLILNKLSRDNSLALLAIFSDENVVKFYDIEVYKTEQQSLELIDYFQWLLLRSR